MSPVAVLLSAASDISSRVCVTAQHRTMLDQVLDLFKITPDYDLDIMVPRQTLAGVTWSVLRGLEPVLEDFRPDIVLVHGDTNTALAASLAAHYQGIAIGHVEAGLRTGDIRSPWPEEANRKLTDAIADLLFAPTESARQNLLAEGAADALIHVTGNTVIDALLSVARTFEEDATLDSSMRERFPFLRPESRLVLITGHRRESFGGGLERICTAVRTLSQEFQDTDFVYPVHLNPNVRTAVNAGLSGAANVFLIEPQDYTAFVWLMRRASLILTDSGGVQEEAPSLGKPVLVMRDTTERPEGVAVGTAKLVGTDAHQIVSSVRTLLDCAEAYACMADVRNPYGDGNASSRIVSALRSYGRCPNA